MCKGVIIFNFTSEIFFGATYIDIWRFLSGHTVCHLPSIRKVHSGPTVHEVAR